MKDLRTVRTKGDYCILESLGVLLLITVTGLRSLATGDISLHDEASYLSLGLRAAGGDLPAFVDGATYIDLYALTSKIVDEPLGLYFAVRAISAASFVLAVWLATRLFARAPYAWLAGAVIAISPAPYVWPGVATPAVAGLLVALAIAWRFSGLPPVVLASWLIWLAAGSRPEYVPAAALATTVALLLTLPGVSSWVGFAVPAAKARLSYAAGALAVPVLLIVAHGFPVDGQGRQWLAFQQHFALRRAAPGQDPWYEAGSVVMTYFGDVAGLMEALVANPLAMGRHVLLNALDAPGTIGGLLVPRQLAASSWISVSLWLSLLLSIGLILWIISRRSGQALGDITYKRFTRRKLPALLLTGGVATCAVVASFVIYPRSHYLLGFAGGLVVVLAVLLSKLGPNRFELIVPLGLSVMVFALFTVQVLQQTAGRMSEPAPMAASVAAMNRDAVEWRLLGIEWGLEPFVQRMERISSRSPRSNESFEQFISRLGINAVLVNGRLQSGNWAVAEGFDAFVSDPGSLGFRPAAPNSPIYLRESPPHPADATM